MSSLLKMRGVKLESVEWHPAHSKNSMLAILYIQDMELSVVGKAQIYVVRYNMHTNKYIKRKR